MQIYKTKIPLILFIKKYNLLFTVINNLYVRHSLRDLIRIPKQTMLIYCFNLLLVALYKSVHMYAQLFELFRTCARSHMNPASYSISSS